MFYVYWPQNISVMLFQASILTSCEKVKSDTTKATIYRQHNYTVTERKQKLKKQGSVTTNNI